MNLGKKSNEHLIEEMIENRHKEILIETFKAFDKFCDDNNIKYFACGGTAIGAVRHKGIIPWDDDIDVCMLRDDYNRFIELKEKCIGTKYCIVDYNDKGYYLPFAKFMDNNTTIWEAKENSFILGVFIDIFPLNYTNDSYKENKDFQHQYIKAFTDYVITQKRYSCTQLIKEQKLRGFKTYIKHLIFRNIQSLLFRRFKTLDEQIRNNKEGNFLLNYYTPYKIEKEIFPKEWFQTQIELPFEDTFIKLPNGYEMYLTQLFGDYMVPPPVEKQESHHSLYFIDLDSRLSIDEIRRKQHE